jgi:hypothetical protein
MFLALASADFKKTLRGADNSDDIAFPERQSAFCHCVRA